MKAGWEVKALGDVFQTVTGNTPSKTKKDYYGDEIPLVKPAELTDSLIHDAADGLTLEGGQAARLAPIGSVLISCIGNLGKTGLAARDVAFNQQINAIFPDSSKAISEFIFYQALSLNFKSQLEALASGTTIPIVNKTRFNSITVNLPPLAEQKRIVSILDEAFEGLDRARENAEANLKSARELFEEALDKMLLVQSTSWSETTLGETYDVRDGTHDSPKYVEIGHPLVTSKNLGPNGLHFNKVKFINENDFTAISKRSEVNTGDVLFAMIGTIGNPVVVEVKPDFAIKNVALFKMINGRSGYFLRYFLSSKRTMTKMMSEAKGTTQQFVGLGYLRGFPIKVPPLEIEDAFVAQVRDIDEKARAIRVHYTSKLQDISDLRQSLLQKAFAGDLT